MAQQHLDRLTSTDAGFLHQEGANSHMHIGGLLIFDGPPPPFDDLLDHVRGRLHLVPRYRQKLAQPPLEAGRAVWIDDVSFNLEYHVRHSALPAPGRFDQLMALVGRITSTRLDRAKPLWEFWLIEGLEPAQGSRVGRFAMITKIHHSLVDGVAGVDLAAALFDASPEGPPPSGESLRPWRPRPEPSAAELVLAGARGAIGSAIELGARTLAAAAQPGRSAQRVRDAAEGVGSIAWAILNPAPESPLNVPIGPHRRFDVVRHRLEDYKAVKDHFDSTINDVVLAVVSGALARWMRSRGLRTDGVELRSLVPVSVRAADEKGQLGNRLTLLRAPLPLYVSDASMRLEVVRREMRKLKASKQALGASTVAAVNEMAPPALLAQVSKLQFSTRLFNLLVTNVPGPQIPLFILGREMRDFYPLAFLPENQALAVAIMSYNGLVEYGLLADFDAIGDLDVIAAGIEASLQDLLAAAGAGVGTALGAGTASSGGKAAGAPKTPAGSPSKAAPSGSKDRLRGMFGAAGAAGGAEEPRRAASTRRQPRLKLVGDTEPKRRRTGPREPAERPGDEPAPLLPSGRRRRDEGPAAEMRAKRRAPRAQRARADPPPEPEPPAVGA